MQRLEARFSGRVQGVGFRATVADLARQFQLCGTVCNVHDGSVKLVAEGDSVELVGFLESIQRQMARNIVSTNTAWSDVSHPEFANFQIVSDHTS